MKPILSFFRPAIVLPPIRGMVADATAELGQLALQQNVNSYSQQMASYATAGTNTTIVAADVVSGIIQLNTGASAGYTATLPTTAQILAALGATVAQDGSFTKIVRIVNNGSGQTATLTAGDTPTTVIGTATVNTNTCRDFAMRVLASAITFTNIGSLTL